MKTILLLVLVGLSISYNANAAVNYAIRHCRNYNGAYNSYPGADCANFVSQCLIAGGLSLSDCGGRDNKGAIPGVSNLKSCLSKKNWHSSSTRPGSFKAGYPFFHNSYSHAMLATSISGSKVYYAGHTNDRCGDVYMTSGVTYYYE